MSDRIDNRSPEMRELDANWLRMWQREQAEVRRLTAVVAVQREALRRIAEPFADAPGYSQLTDRALLLSMMKRARAALDIEEVSEPGPSRPTLCAGTSAGVEVGGGESPGSLTSPVDTAPEVPS